MKRILLTVVIILGVGLLFFLLMKQGVKRFGDSGKNKIIDILTNQGGDKNPSKTITSLRVTDGKIVDSDNKEIYLRGFQGLSAYPIPEDQFVQAFYGKKADTSQFDQLDIIAQDIHKYRFTDFDIQEIKNTGANVVRIWILVHEVKRGTNQYSETAISILEDMINRFGEEGIYSIIVLAGAGENNYPPQQQYLDLGVNLFDPKSSAMQDTLDVWNVLSRRFTNNPSVAGYDVMNEPMPPSPEILHDYYTNLIRTIRSNDPNHIIILPVAQNHRADWQIGGSYDDDNLMVTFHYYEPDRFTLQTEFSNQTYPGQYGKKYWDKKAIEQYFTNALSLPQLKGRPIYIGEFGADGSRDATGGLEWTKDVLDIMNQHGLHYTYHNYKHKVHRGYWTHKPEVVIASRKLTEKIIKGELKYSDVTTEQKRQLFSTQYNSVKRDGIEAILKAAFTSVVTTKSAKDCPDEWIENRMPGGDVEEYFLLDGKKVELDQYDIKWVQDNCELTKQTVY